MKSIIILIVSVILGLSSFAERAVTNVTVTANGTNTAEVALSGICSASTYAELASVYYTSTNGAKATVSFMAKVNGNEASLCSFYATCGDSVYTCKEVSPRRKVTSNQNPDTDKISLFGTNTILKVKQSVATTNIWTFDILYEKD